MSPTIAKKPSHSLARVATALGVLVVALSALLPAGARASMTFGSDLSFAANTNASACFPAANPCTFLLARVHVGNAFAVRAPVRGVMTSFQIKTSGVQTVTFRLGRVAKSPGFLATGGAIGPTVTLPGPGTYSFPSTIRVRAGDSPGIDAALSRSGAADPCFSLPSPKTYLYAPPLGVGGAARGASANAACEWLINATYEPSKRALTLKRCKKRSSRAKRRKCRKNANKLPN